MNINEYCNRLRIGLYLIISTHLLNESKSITNPQKSQSKIREMVGELVGSGNRCSLNKRTEGTNRQPENKETRSLVRDATRGQPRDCLSTNLKKKLS